MSSVQTTLLKEDVVFVSVVTSDNQIMTHLHENEESLVLVTEVGFGIKGDPGIPGPAGGAAVQRNAGVTLSALTVVYELDGLVYPLSAWDGEHIDLILGVTLNAALEGAVINVQRAGDMDDTGWNWTPGRIYLADDGALSETPPTSGFLTLIGSAVSATRIILNIQDPIELE